MAGYPVRCLSGLDYSPGAVRLSQSIAENRGGDAGGIQFIVSDFLREDPKPLPHSVPTAPNGVDMWDLILDKGTYDAIALGQKDEAGRSPAAHLPLTDRAASQTLEDIFSSLVSPKIFHCEGLNFAACNFTEEELQSSFVTPETGLIYQYVCSTKSRCILTSQSSRIQHRTYSFAERVAAFVPASPFASPRHNTR